MANRPALPKQIDITRAIKGAIQAGMIVGRVEVDADGKIVVIAEASASDQQSEWDKI